MVELALLSTLVSVVLSSVWWVRALGFPRLQTMAALATRALSPGLLGWPAHQRAWVELLLGADLGPAAQASFLWSYLPFVFQAVPAAPAGAAGSCLRIVVVNVLSSNRQVARLRRVLEAARPDVLLVPNA